MTSMKRSITTIALICLMALPLIAQAPAAQVPGRWEIVRADYGWGNNWIDVTDRVLLMARGDVLNFRVDGVALVGDRRQGRNRTLRLQLRDRAGRTREVTYRDSQQVVLRVFNTNQRNAQISRATYGIGNRAIDVTARLNSQIIGDRLTLLVTNASMGGDPAPGLDKRLTVQYMQNGRIAQVVVNEGDTLRLIGLSSQIGISDLRINSATYGSAFRSIDVTSRLNTQIQRGQLNLLVNNATMGGDPAPGRPKSLTVQYALNGVTSQIVIREGDTLNLPSGIVTQSNLQINRATYGSGYRTLDVTSRLSSQILGDQLNIRVTNDSMGGDPAPGLSKSLTVLYELNGRSNQIVVNEGETLRLPSGTFTPNGPFGDRSDRPSRGVFSSTTIPYGTELSVRTNEPIDSRNATLGQTFSAVVAEDVLDSSGIVRIPRGSDTTLVIRSVRGDNNNDSNADLAIDVESVTVAGQTYFVSTDDLESQGGTGVGANRKTAVMIGGGAALGAIIGGIAGGGKGAAIGAGVGAGAGLGTEILTGGNRVRVPSETLLNFRLDQDLRLRASR